MRGLGILLASAALVAAPDDMAEAERYYEFGEYAAVQAQVYGAWERIPEPSRPDAVRLLRKATFRLGQESGAVWLAADEVNRRLADGCSSATCLLRLCDALEAGWFIHHERFLDRTTSARWYQQYRQHCAPLPQERSRSFYISGIIGFGELRLAEAWADLVEAARSAEDPIDMANALSVLVELAVRLGRTSVVQRASEAILAAGELILQAPEESHERTRILADHFDNIGWSLLLMREAGYDAGDPRQFLSPALLIVTTPGANHSVATADNIRINLALAAVQRNEVGQAEVLIASVVGDHLSHEELFWLRMIETRLRVKRGDRRGSLRALKAVDALVGSSAPLEMKWHAAHLHGRVLESQGLHAEAITAYQQAEALLDELNIPAALGQGRDHYIHDLQRGARRLVNVQLRLGRERDALCTLRSARARAHRGMLADVITGPGIHARRRMDLDEGLRRCRAEVSAKQRSTCLSELEDRRRALRRGLAAPALPERVSSCESQVRAGELLLSYVQLDDGWVGIAAEGREVMVRRLGDIDPQASAVTLAVKLLEPFAPAIARAAKIRVLATESLHRVRFHMLPWGGQPLLMHAAVAYDLDLPVLPEAQGGARRGAVVVADPTASLRVHDEAQIVRATLEASELGTELLEGADAVRGEVMPLLSARLAHLYIGGHAGVVPLTADPSWLESEDLWDVVLQLEGGTVISVEDILAGVMPGQAPEVVVLMACKTGIADFGTLSGGIGIAQAFLVRGSRAVVATEQDVLDAVARAMSDALYGDWDPAVPFDAAQRLAHAQATLLRRGYPAHEVGKFRSWVR